LHNPAGINVEGGVEKGQNQFGWEKKNNIIPKKKKPTKNNLQLLNGFNSTGNRVREQRNRRESWVDGTNCLGWKKKNLTEMLGGP